MGCTAPKGSQDKGRLRVESDPIQLALAVTKPGYSMEAAPGCQQIPADSPVGRRASVQMRHVCQSTGLT